MKSIRDTASEIAAEVERAEQMWGSEFDKKNTLNDWASYVNSYLADATEMGASSEDVVKNLRKAAGLALSALRYAEDGSLAPRHYDGQQRPESLPDIEISPVGNVITETPIR